MFRFLLLWLLIAGSVAQGEPLRLRVVAANISSGNHQSYSPDNGNHSNIEGAGARILTALQPDIVLIQEFTTTIPVRRWVNETLGEKFSFYQEDTGRVANAIPNGVISRFPMVDSGKWDDPEMENREFAWARIKLPNGKHLWAISVHLYSQKSDVREKEAKALVKYITAKVPPGDFIIVGGDLNTRERGEDCVRILEKWVGESEAPADAYGNSHTNQPRNKPYDWVLACPPLQALEVPVELAGKSFEKGLVFDTRNHPELEKLPPAQPGDSGVFQMQHMAVVKDFLVP